ncbi:MAG TPA: hypothetical protein VFL14_11040 [Xanthomonadales bacterium]|nr:hypothetical protein [Xanthomonadales bacterium]
MNLRAICAAGALLVTGAAWGADIQTNGAPVDSGIRYSVDLRTNTVTRSINSTTGTPPPGIIVFNSALPAETFTSTGSSPRTFIGYPWNAIDPGRPLEVTGLTVFVTNNGAAPLTLTNLQGRFQLWDTWVQANNPVFATPVPPAPVTVDLGPLTFTNGTFLTVDVTFPSPVALTGLTNHGFAANWQGDTGGGLASQDALTTLLRFGASPIAVGSSGLANAYGYRNVAGQTTFNFGSGESRTFGQTNEATVFTVYARAPTVADVGITKTDAPDPVVAGSNVTYTIAVTNATGPDAAETVQWSDPLPAGTTFVSLSTVAGWTCTTPAVGANGTVTCSNPSVAVGSTNSFTLVANVPAAAAGTTLTNTATVTTTSTDGTAGNNSATATTGVGAPPTAAVSGTKSVAGTFNPGGTVTYTVTLNNAGPGVQGDNPGNEFTDVLPAGLTLVSATATSGTAVATVGTNTVTWNGTIAAAGSVTITITATINTGATGTITNQGTISFDSDANGTNNATAVTDNPGTPAAGDGTGFVVTGLSFVQSVPSLSTLGALLAALALLAGGLAVQRRRAMR